MAVQRLPHRDGASSAPVITSPALWQNAREPFKGQLQCDQNDDGPTSLSSPSGNTAISVMDGALPMRASRAGGGRRVAGRRGDAAQRRCRISILVSFLLLAWQLNQQHSNTLAGEATKARNQLKLEIDREIAGAGEAASTASAEFGANRVASERCSGSRRRRSIPFHIGQLIRAGDDARESVVAPLVASQHVFPLLRRGLTEVGDPNVGDSRVWATTHSNSRTASSFTSSQVAQIARL